MSERPTRIDNGTDQPDTFIPDFFAGDALVEAELTLLEAAGGVRSTRPDPGAEGAARRRSSPSGVTRDPDIDPPDGASIIAGMRDYPGGMGGFYVISGEQVEALAEAYAWVSLPTDDSTEFPAAGLDVLAKAYQIATAPDGA